MTFKMPEPVAYQYLFDGPYGGVWQNNHVERNGVKPKAWRPLYTADALRDVLEQAAQAVLSAPIKTHRQDTREACANAIRAMTEAVK